MRVSDVVKNKDDVVYALQADRPLVAAISLMAAKGIGSVVVLDEDGQRSLGIVSEPDIISVIHTYGAKGLCRNLRQAMRTPPQLCSPNDSVADALARMTRQRVRYLLVGDADDTTIVLVSIGDLVKARLESVELESRVLRDMACSKIIAGAS